MKTPGIHDADNIAHQQTTDCSGTQVKRMLASFASAFNSGDVRRTEAMIADRPLFQWYGSNPPGPRTGLEARDRESLEAYFRWRHAQDDELRFIEFRFNGNSGGYGNFQFKEFRSADDLAAGTVTRRGKGAAVCFGSETQIAVLNL